MRDVAEAEIGVKTPLLISDARQARSAVGSWRLRRRSPPAASFPIRFNVQILASDGCQHDSTAVYSARLPRHVVWPAELIAPAATSRCAYRRVHYGGYRSNSTGLAYPGVDYLMAYWLGRYLGVFSAAE